MLRKQLVLSATANYEHDARCLVITLSTSQLTYGGNDCGAFSGADTR